MATRSASIMERGDYDQVVAHLADLAELLTPDEVAAGQIPAEILPVARWIVERGTPRGDEGRVMGALLLIAGADADSDETREERERVARWGVEARASISNPIERFGSLISVWEQHESLAPHPEALALLARLYGEQAEALSSATMAEMGADGRLLRVMSAHQLRLAPLLVQRAPLDVAAVYLRHGDLPGAVGAVRAMGDASSISERLVPLLERANGRNASGAQTLLELANGYRQVRPGTSVALCRLGLRRFPDDVRFPRCLAAVAIGRRRMDAAVGWYAEAVALAPDDRDIHDEALSNLAEVLQAGLFSAPIESSRTTGLHALRILAARDRRWPEAAPPVTREALLLNLGRAEASAGQPRQALARLRESLEANETMDAHREIGTLLQRLGEWDDAAHHLRRALDLLPGEGATARLERAVATEALADAFRLGGNEGQSQRLYRQALDAWTAGREQSEQANPRALIREGILQGRLGDERAARATFERVLEAAPTSRDAYGEILAYLVVASPDSDLATRVLRRAMYQVAMEPVWRVYFALWVQTVAARGGGPPDAEISDLLGELSDGTSWRARLAAFGHGDLDEEALLEAASTTGERTEALFYIGVSHIAGGDLAQARRRFEEALSTNMVSYFEYIMARELLLELGRSGTARSATSP